MEQRKREGTMLVLTLLGAALMLPPIVYLFNRPIGHAGIPQIVIYLFVLWLVLIAATALLNRFLPREPAATSGEGD